MTSQLLGFFKRNIIALAVAGAALAVGALIGFFVISGGFSSPSGYSSSFLAARNDAASISQDIVALTAETGSALKQANALDLQGSSDQAVALIAEAQRSNEDAADEAEDLSLKLKQLTMEVDALPEAQRELGYQAVATAFWLVGEFGNYTGHVNAFLSQLSVAVSEENSADRRASLDQALARVNTSVERINELNLEFRTRMAEFDRAMAE